MAKISQLDITLLFLNIKTCDFGLFRVKQRKKNLSPSRSSVVGGGRQRGARLEGAGRGSFNRAARLMMLVVVVAVVVIVVVVVVVVVVVFVMVVVVVVVVFMVG